MKVVPRGRVQDERRLTFRAWYSSARELWRRLPLGCSFTKIAHDRSLNGSDIGHDGAIRKMVDLRHLSNLDLAGAMEWLERLPGVARKNSAGVMNASAFNRRAMVIDGHHRRIMQRMGIVPAKADTAKTYDALMPIVPGEWSAEDMDEHHLLLKKLGQTHCRPRKAECDGCPVRTDCKTGTAGSSAR